MQKKINEINWSDPQAMVSDYFSVRDALWLPQWNRLANEKDGLNDKVKAALIDLFDVMDWVRDFLGVKITVHCAYRPDKYNKLVKGAKASMHLFGGACDWHAEGLTCDEVRAKLVPKLDEWLIRMEDLPKSNWVHIDRKQTKPRYFKP